MTSALPRSLGFVVDIRATPGLLGRSGRAHSIDGVLLGLELVPEGLNLLLQGPDAFLGLGELLLDVGQPLLGLEDLLLGLLGLLFKTPAALLLGLERFLGRLLSLLSSLLSRAGGLRILLEMQKSALGFKSLLFGTTDLLFPQLLGVSMGLLGFRVVFLVCTVSIEKLLSVPSTSGGWTHHHSL